MCRINTSMMYMMYPCMHVLSLARLHHSVANKDSMLSILLAGIPGLPAAFYHFLMDTASHVTIKKCQRTWLAGDRSSS